jgi:hypothetical protein
MLKVISVAAIAALALAVTATAQPASARDGGAVAAGVIGGLAVGAIVGSQMNRDQGYGYRDEGYRASYRECHVERQEVTDRYGNYRIRRVRVCD